MPWPDEPDFPEIPPVAVYEAAATEGPQDESEFFWNTDPEAEVRSLGRGRDRDELKAEADENEHDRSERFRNNFEHVAIAALWLSSAAVGIVAIVWLSQLLLPAKWRWLSVEDISHVQSIVTAGLLVGVIGNHFKRRIGKSDDRD